MKPTVLIRRTGNPSRSHLGEGILNAQSAGSQPPGCGHPVAIKVMREIGIDISKHDSKSSDQSLLQPVNTVNTVWGHMDQIFPIFPEQVDRIHHGFDNPAHAKGSPEEIRDALRRVRDEIRVFLTNFITTATLARSGNQPIPT